MLSNATLQTRMLWLVLGVALPFSALLVWYLGNDEQKARDAVFQRLEVQASATADRIGAVFAEHQVALGKLASRPGLRAMAPEPCELALDMLAQTSPPYASLALRRLDGGLVCAPAKAEPSRLPPELQQINELIMAQAEPMVSPVFASPESKRVLVALSAPVLNQQDAHAGALMLSIDLARLNERLFALVSPDVTVTVFESNGALALRSADPGPWIGQAIAAASLSPYKEGLKGRGTLVDVDGVRRMVAWATVPGMDWRVSAGVVESEAMGPYLETRRRVLTAIALLLLLAAYLAYRQAKSMNRAVSQLAGVAQGVVNGDLSARAAVSGPRELGALATQFNALLDVRSKALADLGDSETRWKFAIEGAGDGLWDWDVPAGTAYFSPRWKTMLDHSEDEIGNGLTEWSSRVHPDDMKAVMAELQPHLDGLTPSYQTECRMRCKDGSFKWILTRGLVVARDSAGKPLRVVGTHHDISERKRLEHSLQVNLALMDSVVDDSPSLIYAFDLQGRCLWVNRSFEQYFGRTRAQLIGKTRAEGLAGVMPPDVAQEHLANDQTAIASQMPYEVEESNEQADGTHWYWTVKHPLKDANGHIIGVAGTSTDITLRKREQEALRRSDDQYRELLNVSPVPCALNDEAQNITFLNQAFIETFGYTLDDIPNLDAWWPRAYPDPQYRALMISTWQERMAAMLSSGKPFEPVEACIHCKDGSVRTALISPAPLSKQTHGLHLVALVDISARKAAELELRETDRRLRDLMDSTDGIVWEADAHTFRCISISPNAERMLGYPLADWLQPGFWASHIHPEDHDYAVEYSAACTGRLENYSIEYRYITADKRTIWLRDIVKVVVEGGQARCLRGLMIDITQSRMDAATLRTNTDLLEYSQAATKVGGWELTIATGHLYWTNETYRIHETKPAEFNPTVDAGVSYFLPESREKITAALGLAIGQGVGYALELQTYTTKGKLIDVFTTCTVTFKDGKPAKLTGIFQDITERKQIEQALRASLSDKVALLKEVHHRVKNNLQIITSLLRLEARRSTVPEAVDVLKAMQGRIRAMAQLHESLYRSGTFASVDLGVYLGQIASQAFQAQLLSNQQVALKLDMASLNVGMDQAVACGLLVNELVSNALKHGFPNDRAGQVNVSLQPADPATVQTDALWRLRVSDSGAGLSADFETKRKTSLGLILAEDLSQQIGGSLTIQSQPDAGAEFSVVFKALEPAALVMPS